MQVICVCAQLLQSWPTLCNPMDCSLPGSFVHGILQQESWRGLPCSPPGDLPGPGIKLKSPASPALRMNSLPTEPPGKPAGYISLINIQILKLAC